MNILKKGMLVLLGLALGVAAQAATEPTVNYVYNDHLGTPRVVVNSANKVIWQNEGEPFGNVAPQEDPDGDGVKYTLNLRFPGQYYDSESGRNQNYYRDYNPQTGRYIQSDPIGLGGGINTYGYVSGNSVQISDRLGLMGNCGTANGPCVQPNTNNLVDTYCRSVIDRIKEGVSFEGSAGGAVVFGLGIKQTGGVTRDGDRACVTNSTCLLIGPMAGGYTSGGVSVSTGSVSPSGAIWQVGAIGSGVVGLGKELGGVVGSDGSLEGSAEGAMGGALGAALQVCRKRVTNACTK